MHKAELHAQPWRRRVANNTVHGWKRLDAVPPDGVVVARSLRESDPVARAVRNRLVRSALNADFARALKSEREN